MLKVVKSYARLFIYSFPWCTPKAENEIALSLSFYFISWSFTDTSVKNAAFLHFLPRAVKEANDVGVGNVSELTKWLLQLEVLGTIQDCIHLILLLTMAAIVKEYQRFLTLFTVLLQKIGQTAKPLGDLRVIHVTQALDVLSIGT